MKKTVYGLWFIVYSIFLLSAVCYAQPAVSSVELIDKAKEFDGKEVIYEGEVIGEAMVRGEHFWVNLNDGQNAIGVWLGNNFLSLISFAGSYKAKGDWLEVRGIFNRTCKMHGGDLDIHGLNVIKLRNGRLVKHTLVSQKQRLAIILSGVLLCLLILQLLNKRLKKK